MASGTTGQSIVLVGGGPASHACAAALRERGHEGPITIVCGEPAPPYDRTLISKDVLAGRKPLDEAALHEASFYAERDIELRLGVTATALDPARRTLETDDGEIPYGKLLLAPGCEPIAPRIEGAPLDGLHELHTAADVAAVRAAVAGGARRAVIVGAGFVGAEGAANLRALGLEVTLLERADVPMDHSLGPEVGAIVARVHDEEGVRFLAHRRAVELLGDGAGAVRAVRDSEGEEHAAEIVIAALGVRPATELARAAGAAVSDGIVVDSSCRTSLPDVFAAGDASAFPSPYAVVPGRMLRPRHYANALAQGAHAAAAMLGDDAPYRNVPWFWSDQYDMTLRWVGGHRVWDEIAWRGDSSSRSFTALYLNGGELVAACVAGRGRDFRAAKRLVAPDAPSVDPGVLRDPGADLYELVKRSRP